MIFGRRQSTLTNEDALNARPVRLVDADMAEKPDGGGTLTVTLRPPDRMKWLFKLPAGSKKTFEFDGIGVFVWKNIDGKTSVEQIIKRLAKQYNLNLREAQVPTLQFLQTLMKKGLVGVPAEKEKS
ncbi:MAG: PqqD family protein [Tepidisphaeraceae bacterium]